MRANREDDRDASLRLVRRGEHMPELSTHSAPFLHPVGEDLSAVTNQNWIPAHATYWCSVVLMHFSLIGLYARQVTQAGRLGLVSLVLAIIGTTFVGSILVMLSTVLPLLAADAPLFSRDQWRGGTI